MQVTKYCSSCEQDKPIDQFTKTSAKNSYKTVAATHTYCKECNAARAREWRKANPNYRGTGKIKAIPVEDRLLMSAIRSRLSDARERCRKLGKAAPELDDMFLYEMFLEQNRLCALTGVELVIEKNYPTCLSLDQIDPSKGYVKGNVQWLAWCVNRAKGDLSLEHFYQMCEVVLENRKEQRLS